MRALQRQVADVWQAAVETDTRLTHERGLEAEAETVAISVAFAVTAIRVLDLEIFGREYPRRGKTYRSSQYERFRDRDVQGRVVSGTVVIRNAEIHLPVLIDSDVDRAVSIPGTAPTRFRVFPRWRPYRVLPQDVRQDRRKGDRRRQANAYRSHLARRLVIETLLDALAFFLHCDPSMARRTADGELEHFPLPELVQHDPYERRHPEWPLSEVVAAQARGRAASRPPAGIERVILHRLTDPNGDVEAYVGATLVTPGYWEAFTERPEQIASDVAAGFRYKVQEERVLADASGRLMLGNDRLDAAVPLPAPSTTGSNEGLERSEESWQELLRLMEEDGFLYARQRSTS